MWQQREMENYLCHRDVLLDYADEQGKECSEGSLFSVIWRQTMEDCINELEQALGKLGKSDPWGTDIKATDECLDPLFKNFYETLKRPSLVRKNDYHGLAKFLNAKDIDAEIVEKLDAIVATAQRVQSCEEGNVWSQTVL